MQTYTHLLVGAVIGTACYPNDIRAQMLCVAGSAVPDVPATLQFVLDKISRRPPLEKEPLYLQPGKEFAHSLVVAGALLWFGNEANTLLPEIWVIAFSIGMFSHILIDMLTHKAECYRETDCGYLWPIPLKIRIAIWEYRYGTGILKPKPFEACCLIVLSLAGILLVLRR